MFSKHSVISAYLTLLCAAATLPVLYELGRKAEPLVLPVLSNVNLVFDEDLVYADFEKLRSCEFEGIYWFTGATWLKVEFEEVWSRPEGSAADVAWTTYPLRNPEDFPAVVRHRCHPLWFTETELWNPRLTSSPILERP